MASRLDRWEIVVDKRKGCCSILNTQPEDRVSREAEFGQFTDDEVQRIERIVAGSFEGFGERGGAR